MCGISGFNFRDKELLRRMNKVTLYRGPDDKGEYIDRFVSLGQNRLSIIDLKKGLYPIHNEKDSLQLIYNGEIYNFKEIREDLEKKGHKFYSNCDGEVIIHAYEEYGIDCLKKFNGMFSICIYDIPKRQLFFARDRIGIKPLFYYLKDDEFIFCSEIKGILEHPIKRKINKTALYHFMNLRYVLGNQTIFEDIFSFPAASYGIFDLKEKKLSVHKYWDVEENIIDKDEEYFIEELRNLIKDSIKKRLISDVPLGIYLSGGIDSSGIVGLLSSIKKENNDSSATKTFSVGFKYGEHVDELASAKIVSEAFGTEHKQFRIDPDICKILPDLIKHFDQPFADPAAIPVYELSRKATKDVTVVLTGDGGDELFGGYDQYKFLLMKKKLDNIPFLNKKILPFIFKKTPKKLLDKLYKYMSNLGDEGVNKLIDFLSTDDDLDSYFKLVSIFNNKEKNDLILDKKISGDLSEYVRNYFEKPKELLNKYSYIDIKFLLPDCYLPKTDRSTMAHSIEGRVPLLDHRIVEFAFKVPPNLKLNKISTKYILRRVMFPYIPKELIKKKKQTFHVPIGNWIEKELKEKFEQILNKEELNKHGLFNPKYIQKIFNKYSNSKLVYARQLWNLVNFQLWYNIYIENGR